MTHLFHVILQMLKHLSNDLTRTRAGVDMDERIRDAKERALESTPETIQFLN